MQAISDFQSDKMSLTKIVINDAIIYYQITKNQVIRNLSETPKDA